MGSTRKAQAYLTAFVYFLTEVLLAYTRFACFPAAPAYGTLAQRCSCWRCRQSNLLNGGSHAVIPAWCEVTSFWCEQSERVRKGCERSFAAVKASGSERTSPGACLPHRATFGAHRGVICLVGFNGPRCEQRRSQLQGGERPGCEMSCEEGANPCGFNRSPSREYEGSARRVHRDRLGHTTRLYEVIHTAVHSSMQRAARRRVH